VERRSADVAGQAATASRRTEIVASSPARRAALIEADPRAIGRPSCKWPPTVRSQRCRRVSSRRPTVRTGGPLGPHARPSARVDQGDSTRELRHLNGRGVHCLPRQRLRRGLRRHFPWDLRRVAASPRDWLRQGASTDAHLRDSSRVRASTLQQVRALSRASPPASSTDARPPTGCADDLHAAASRPAISARYPITRSRQRPTSTRAGERRCPTRRAREVQAAYRRQSGPSTQARAQRLDAIPAVVGRSGFGIGSAGLPAYN
jgi:hypothetical protein